MCRYDFVYPDNLVDGISASFVIDRLDRIGDFTLLQILYGIIVLRFELVDFKI